jgi:Uma2 family endonuclease
MAVQALPTGEIQYPDADGEPMSDNTLQYDWITRIKDGFEVLYKDDPNVFIAGNLLWYPVEGRPDLRVASDVMVVLGRPKGYRGSYQQWLEEGVIPQLAFEIISPGNTFVEMSRKLDTYERYGVEEFYAYDPHRNDFGVWVLSSEDGRLRPADFGEDWVSPRTGVRFHHPAFGELKVYRPDGQKFRSMVEAERRSERMAARLRELGIEPDEV